MALIARAIKAGSGTGDYANGTTISSTEVNTDFNTAYNELNGNLNSANLATNAVTTVKITDANVTTPKIADLNVTTAKIANLGVTVGKIAIGQSVNARQSANVTTGITVTNDATETTIVTLPSITTRGGVVTVGGQWGLTVSGIIDSVSYYRLRLYRDASVVQAIDIRFTNFAASSDFPVAMPSVLEQPAAGSYIYKITCQLIVVGGTAGRINTPVANAGSAFVKEEA